jgi:hypothetical protein
MAFTESLLLQKGHFLSSKRGRSLQEYFFRSLNGALQPRKKGTFSLFEKVGGGAHTPLPPPPVPRPLVTQQCWDIRFNCLIFFKSFGWCRKIRKLCFKIFAEIFEN